MSHAFGIVFQDGREVGYFEYNGTADFAQPNIRSTPAEVERYWRQPDFGAHCQCGDEPTDVTLYTDYGYGFHWQAKACLPCSVIVGGTDPYHDGLPARGKPIRETETGEN